MSMQWCTSGGVPYRRSCVLCLKRVAYLVQTNGVSSNCNTELPERTNAVTSQYAAAGVKLARHLQLPYVDLWTELAKREGWETEFLEDGLHLTPAGNKAVFDLIAAKIHEAIPALRCFLPSTLFKITSWLTQHISVL